MDAIRISSETLIARVHDLLMSGAARWQVDAELRKLAEKNGASPPAPEAIDQAYAECVNRWIDDANEAPETVTAYHLSLRKSLIAACIRINDYPAAARVATDLAKLQQQYSTTAADRAKRPSRDRRIAKLRNARPDLRLVDKYE